MSEACSVRFGDQLISFFGSILEFCRPGNPFSLWEKYKSEMMHHLLYKNKCSQEEAENIVLQKLKDQLNRSGSEMSHFNLPEPKVVVRNNTPTIILSETNYDKEELLSRSLTKVNKMTDEQKLFFQEVTKSVTEGKGGTFCLNAAGGTGKTFTLNTLLDSVRGDGFVALATASSGVASKLLENGTTVHSRFKVPINITATSMCNFTASDATGKLLKLTKLIIMDEMTMLHKHVFEAIDRSLKDLIGSQEPFGGITVVFSGDWRQCLPIVRRGGRADVVNACLKSSRLWNKTRIFCLSKNMRVELTGESQMFSDLLMKVGDGSLPENRIIGESMIELPSHLFTQTSMANGLVNEVFLEFNAKFADTAWVKNRAILCPTNR